jgi:DNA-directed RNA polymerase subunit RPC12/RpoP
MIRMVDMKCLNCGHIDKDILYEDDKEYPCRKCNSKMARLYGSVNKYKEYPEGYYENFDNEPVYIKDRSDFYKKCKQYGVEPKVPKNRRKKDVIRIFT